MSQREVVLISHRGRSNAAPSCNRTRACEVRRAAAASQRGCCSDFNANSRRPARPVAGHSPHTSRSISTDKIRLDVAAIVDRRSANSYTWWSSSQAIQVEPVVPHSLLPRAYDTAFAANQQTRSRPDGARPRIAPRTWPYTTNSSDGPRRIPQKTNEGASRPIRPTHRPA